MRVDDDKGYYARRAQEELDRAARTSDPSAKRVHLDLAARYATLGERSHAPHKPD